MIPSAPPGKTPGGAPFSPPPLATHFPCFYSLSVGAASGRDFFQLKDAAHNRLALTQAGLIID
jgi:hypothetical protein